MKLLLLKMPPPSPWCLLRPPPPSPWILLRPLFRLQEIGPAIIAPIFLGKPKKDSGIMLLITTRNSPINAKTKIVFLHLVLMGKENCIWTILMNHPATRAVDIKLLGSQLKKICGEIFFEWISFPAYEQKVDIEKSKHHTLVTSDIRKQIMEINQKAREEWDPKQSETEKLQKPIKPEGGDEVDCNKEKHDGRAKSLKQTKVNKEEDDKLRATAANDVAWAAVGGDDMFSKGQLIAEQARQKRKDSLTTSPSTAKASVDSQEIERSGRQNAALIFGSSRKSVRSQMLLQTEVTRYVSVEDVIAVLEREPQMSKSEISYRLYEKCNADIDA